MDIERIRELRWAEPFKPFLLLLEDGRRFLVDKPYYLAIAPKRDLLLVVAQDDRASWFGPERVKEAIVLESAPQK
jgi:hypothetical protein